MIDASYQVCDGFGHADSNPAIPETLYRFSPALIREGYAGFHPGSIARFETQAKSFMRDLVRYVPGVKFGRLTLLSRVDDRHGKPMLECQCECGNRAIVASGNLGNSHTRSCGCLLAKHLKSNSLEYKTWIAIKRRCCDPGNGGYPRYGARGIKICDKWINDFPAFFADMGPRPSKKHSIDRIDNEGHYEPGNCRWATSAEQGRNKRNTTFFEFNGKKQTLPEWSRELRISHSTLVHRIYDFGWPHEKAFSVPPNQLFCSTPKEKKHYG